MRYRPPVIAFLRMCRTSSFERINPGIKVLNYMHEYQAMSTGKLSLVETLPVFGQTLLPSTKIQLLHLGKNNFTECILFKMLI